MKDERNKALEKVKNYMEDSGKRKENLQEKIEKLTNEKKKIIDEKKSLEK